MTIPTLKISVISITDTPAAKSWMPGIRRA
jgi:hypothetical protein